MFWHHDRGTVATLPSHSARPDTGRLRALIDQATEECLDESDEHAGLLCMIREEVACPFHARLDDAEVECVHLEWPRNGYGLNAVCKARGKTQVVDITKLEWVEPLPKGHQWIEAYLAWRDLVD